MLLTACLALAADAPPDSDVFLVDIDLVAGHVGVPRNLTSRAGYDNQPAFSPDGAAIYYVADVAGGPTEVYRYDLAAGAATRVTDTREAEFSPTPLVDGFSAVRVGAPDAEVEAYTESQELWRYTPDGGAVANVLPGVRRVGYHAWLDASHVAVVLVGPGGEPPHALAIVDVASGKVTPVAPDVGRSLGASGGRLYFVDKHDPVSWVIESVALGGAAPTRVVATPPGLPGEAEDLRSEDFRVVGDGTLLAANGTQLLRWRSGASWEVLADVGSVGGVIKRLALSPGGTQLAFVVQREAPK